ncbi:PRC-barrel domain-containing protein [Flavobacterium cellulosilyticum]|uniref:PRC-barrel domain containing protein n=1 Tax=Flavobacterium cellulosilyticum TaxID=2541731 RepID=A0A4R5CF18_9FLAO|nr:PRC-barrel domain-containing protein [Flavobacterium cellulosilyticum]TDD96883.1 PRC-barrel domain containing protein [Flavobacterium cellulosilyticum]
MKRKIKSLIGFTIHATDGEIGKVKEFYFDDRTWTIRYIIVETGSWLIGRKILLSPQALLTPDWEKQTFPVNLTMAQIKDSPKIDTDKPISRQHEMDLYGYYPWGNYYWGGSMGNVGMGMSYPIGLKYIQKKEPDVPHDSHLRSTEAISGYNIQATDGGIGDVEDLIINDQTWAIDYLEVDTGNCFPGKKVLIAPKWISEINWETSSVIVNASEDQVKNSPKYIDNQALSDSYETDLQNYYEYIKRK